MNDLLAGFLAAEFGVPFEPSGRRSSVVRDTDRIVLTLPKRLDRAIERAAARADESKRNVVVRVVSERLGVEYAPTGRWPANAA